MLSLNAAQQALVDADYKTVRWQITLTDVNGGQFRSGALTPDLLDDDCSTLAGWTDGSTGDADVEIAPAGQFHYDSNTSADGNREAVLYKTISTPPDQYTLEIKIKCDVLGTFAEYDFFYLSYSSSINGRFRLYFASDGLFIITDNAGGTTQVGAADIVKCNASADWQTWRFEVDKSAGGANTIIGVYLDGIFQGNISSTYTTNGTNGRLYTAQSGYTNNNQEAHIDYIKIATGLGAIDASPDGDIDPVVLMDFSGIELRRNMAENTVIAPSDVSFSISNPDNVLDFTDFKGGKVLVELFLTTTYTLKFAGWLFRIKTAEPGYQKIKIVAEDFLQYYLDGDYPNTRIPEEIFPSNRTYNKAICLPVPFGTAFIPLRNIYEPDDDTSYIMLGDTSVTYTISKVRNPREIAFFDWPSDDYTFTPETITDEQTDEWSAFQALVAGAGQDEPGIWRSGNTYYDPLVQFTRSDTVAIVDFADVIAFVLKDFGVPAEYIDEAVSFDAASTIYTGWGLACNGAFYYKQTREAVLAQLLNACHSCLRIGEKIELHPLVKESKATITAADVLRREGQGEGTFSYRMLVNEKANDSFYIAWQKSGEPQDELVKTLVMADASADNIANEVFECRFVQDDDHIQRIGTLLAQRKFLKDGEASFDAKSKHLVLQPDDRITLDEGNYGGNYVVLVDSVKITKDLTISIRGTRYLTGWDDWGDLTPGSITIATDTVTSNAAWSPVIAGPDSAEAGKMPNLLPGRLRVGDTANYIVLDPNTPLRISVLVNDVEKVRIGNLNGFLGYDSALYGIAIGETTKYLKYDPTNGLRIAGAITASTIDIGTGANSFHVDADGNIWSGAAVFADGVFSVSKAGAIKATSGVIAGFTIDATEGLYAETGATRVQMKPGAGIWAGATAIGDAPFSVTNAGAIKATSGTIGGWTLGADTISTSGIVLNKTTPAILMGAATDYLTGEGMFFGKASALWKFHVGDPAKDYISYDGEGNLHITGDFTGSTDLDGTIANTYTINSDLDDVTSILYLGRTTGGNASFSWNGTTVTANKSLTLSADLYTDHISEITGAHGVAIDGVTLKDGGALVVTGGTNTFNITNGTAILDVAAGSTVNIDKSITVNGQAVTITGADQANTITLNESFTIGGGHSGTLTFSAASKVLTVSESLTLNAQPVGGLSVATSANTIGSLAVGLTTQILVGGGAGTVPAWGTDIPTAVTIGSKYVYRVDGTDVAVADGGTNISSYAVGDLIYASGATTLAKLADVAVGSYLRSGGVATAPLWSTLILPNAATAYRLPVATAANTIGELAAVGATGEYLKGNTGAIPSWATLNQAAVAGLTTADSPVFVTVKLSGLTDNYFPYHVSDAGGFSNSIMYRLDASTIVMGSSRPITFNTSIGSISIKGSAGGWATGLYFSGNADTQYGGFGAFGNADALTYWWIGSAYNATNFRIYPTDYVLALGGIRIGSTATDPGDSNLFVEGTITSAGALLPSVSNTPALGSTTYMWADLFLGSGAVVNFNNGDIALTHSADNLTLSGGAFSVGNDILATTAYTSNVGALAKKFLTIHAAELWVETLVAQDTMATIGGRILVGPTTLLTADLADDATTIYVKHNNLANGDRVYLEANGKVEFMAVASAAGGAGPYSYTVTRDLDETGANVWNAGDAVFNTGTTGDGFIDLYSVQGVKGSTQAGPTIVGNVRTGTTYNAWVEAWAIGNLKGLYGYGSDTYGAAFGKYSAANYMTVDPTDGIRFLDADDAVRAQLSSTTWTLGLTSDNHVEISAGHVYLKNGATVYTDLAAGVLTLGATDDKVVINDSGMTVTSGGVTRLTALDAGVTLYGDNATTYASITSAGMTIVDDSATKAVFGANTTITGGTITIQNVTNNNDKIVLAENSFKIYDNNVEVGSFGATTTIGLTGGEHISISATAVQMKNNATVLVDLTNAVLTLGDSGNEHILINDTGMLVKDGATVLAQFAATTTIGLTASEHISISSTAIQLKDAATVHTELVGGELILGDDNTAKDWISISSANGVRIYGNEALRFQALADGTLKVGNVAGANYFSYDGTDIKLFSAATDYIWLDADAGIKLYSGSVLGLQLLSTGQIIVGAVDASKSNIAITSNAVQLRTNTTVHAELTTAGVLVLGDDGAAEAEYLEISSSGVLGYAKGAKLLELKSDGNVFFGDQGNEHIKLSPTGLEIIDNATVLATYGATTTIGQVAADKPNILIGADNLSFRINTDAVVTMGDDVLYTLPGFNIVGGTYGGVFGIAKSVKTAYYFNDDYSDTFEVSMSDSGSYYTLGCFPYITDETGYGTRYSIGRNAGNIPAPFKDIYIHASNELEIRVQTGLGNLNRIYMIYGATASSNMISLDTPGIIQLNAGTTVCPASGGTTDLGSNTLEWADAYAEAWNVVADFYHLDDRDDLSFLHQIKGSGFIDARTGLELVDDNTLPDWLLTKAKKDLLEGKSIIKKGDTLTDDRGRPFIPLHTAISWCWGMIRQLDNKVEAIKKEMNHKE